MISKNKIDDVTVDDLQKLIDNEIPEGRTLEYKEKLCVSNDEEKREFLADISSFANTEGGDIIFGISENRENGLPKLIVGIDISNTDEECRKINSIIQNGLQSRITPVLFKLIKLSDCKYVLIIRVKKSWNSPHRIIFKSWDKFFARNSKGKYPLDVIDLKNAFTLSESRFDKVKNFVNLRVHNIYYGDSPLQTAETPKIILHVIPINAFDPQESIDFTQFSNEIKNIKALTGHMCAGSFNSDGKIKIDLNPTDGATGYVQLFRTGIIEAVDSKYIIGGKDCCIPLTLCEEKVIDACRNYLQSLKLLNIEGPIVIFLSLVGMQKFTRCENKTYLSIHRDLPQIQKETVTLPDVMIDNYDENIEKIMKTVFDALANACGLEKSSHYDNNGEWKNR